MKVINGIDVLLRSANPVLKNGKWGLVTNAASLTENGTPNRQALIQAGWQISCLFSPEHGLSARGADGMKQSDHIDNLTQLPVFSLYGSQFSPPEDLLKSIDGILFDLPDVGVRFYTYIWTLSHIMESCDKSGIHLVILDRPNPLSGNLAMAEGPMLDESGFASFIGRWSIPVRHSLSVGELAKLWRWERKLNNLYLTIIPCQNWDRDQYFSDFGQQFTPPSPAISQPETLLTYPALCFMEGVNVNEGRGTDFAFQQFGAPWLNSKTMSQKLNEIDLPGVDFAPVVYMPDSSRYAHKICNGIRLIVKNKITFRPVQTGLYLLAMLKIHYPEKMQWARYPTNANPAGEHHLDLLLGADSIRKAIENHPEQLLKQIPKLIEAQNWMSYVARFLLY